MIKKLIFTLTGTGSLFSFSLGKYLNILPVNSLGESFKLSPSRGGALSNFSSPYKISIDRKVSPQKQKSSLNNYYFGDWASQSKGASDSIYFVTKDGLTKEIKPKVHGQKKRYMKDGMFIDKNNYWFGPRTIPFSKVSTENQKIKLKDLLQQWKSMKKNFLSLNHEELKNLSKWFQENLEENAKCEIIDVFMDCQEFKKAISLTGTPLPISRNFRINFEKLNELASKEWGDKLPKFSDVLGSRGVLFIGKLSGFESKFGSLLDSWVEKELKRNKLTTSSGKPEEIDGIQLMRALSSGEYFRDGCEEYSKNEAHKIVFAECFTESKANFEGYPNIEGEGFLIPKVVDVVKAGTLWSKPVYAPSRYELKPGNTQEERNNYNHWKNLPSELDQVVAKGFKDNGGWKGIIDASCSNVQASGGLSWLLSFATGNPLEKMGCWEFYNLFFNKNFVREQRWCLFSVPETKSFIKEIHIFGPFLTSSWNNGNKFWAKCDFLGL